MQRWPAPFQFSPVVRNCRQQRDHDARWRLLGRNHNSWSSGILSWWICCAPWPLLDCHLQTKSHSPDQGNNTNRAWNNNWLRYWMQCVSRMVPKRNLELLTLASIDFFITIVIEIDSLKGHFFIHSLFQWRASRLDAIILKNLMQGSKGWKYGAWNLKKTFEKTGKQNENRNKVVGD